MLKLGHGIDSHAFTDGDHVTLGGVRIPHDKAIASHSDGDVLLHAIVDALLGAMALGDIGQLFPSTDPQWKDANSRKFLETAVELVKSNGGLINNVDSTLILQQPVVAPYVDEMRRNIAEILAIDIAHVSVKATTTDHLGFTGRNEGLAAMATVVVEITD